jgi:hypothetical protein
MLKPKLKGRNAVPYGNYFVLDLPDKGMIGKGTNFDQLLTSIKAYRKANAVPIGLDFENEVERETCFRYPDECQDSDSRIPKTQQKLSAGDVIRGTRMMIKFKLAGSPLVDQETANARAATCSACPLQRSIALPCDSGGICQELLDFVKSIIGGRSTPYDKNLKSCGICHCSNAAAAWVPLEIQQSVLTKEQVESFKFAVTEVSCWKGIGLP